MAVSRRYFFTQACASAMSIVWASSWKKSSVQAANRPGVNPNTLLISFNLVKPYLTVQAELKGQKHLYQLSEKTDKIIFNLVRLYLNLESSLSSREEILGRSQWLGNQFLSPLTLWIEECDEIQFIISENSIRFPLDFLQYRGLPLFLQKPVTYSFSPINSILEFSEDWSAFILSDPTADPERGAAFLTTILANSIYYDLQDLTLSTLNFIEPKDVILISAHGIIHSNRGDHIALKQESILPDHLARLAPRLIYLDSCQLGVSYEFIQRLKSVKTNYYVAPILSNEAGNSSTKTIKLFFESLQKGLSPSLALFHTRTQLYEDFQVTDTYRKLMWRAFPFRVYQLN